MATEDECAYSAAGFVGGQPHQALFEMARDGAGIPRTRVPGGRGDHLVGADSPFAQADPVHEGAASGVGVAESFGIGIDVRRLRGLEHRISERTLQVTEPPTHEAQVSRPSRPSDQLTDKGAGAPPPGEVDGERISGEQQLGQGPQLHDTVIAAVAGGGGPAVGLRPAPVRSHDDLRGVLRALVREPREPGVFPYQRVVELGVVAVDLHPAGNERPVRDIRIAVEPATEQVLTAFSDRVQTDGVDDVPLVEAYGTVLTPIEPLLEVIGCADLRPFIECAPEDSGAYQEA